MSNSSIRARGVRILVGAVVLGLVTAGGVTSARADEGVDEPFVVEIGAPQEIPAVGFSTAAEEIAAAAQALQDGHDGAVVASLVAAASAAEALPMSETAEGLQVLTTEGTETVLDTDGYAEASHPELPSVGIQIPGDTGDVVVTDDALVWSDVTTSTDMVARATEGGMQVVAVLTDAAAPSEIDFELDLPLGASLTEQTDGSIDIVAPVEVEKVVAESIDELNQQIDAIMGDDFDENAELTAEQEAALVALPEPETTIVEEVVDVATIAPAWAIDANGASVETHYELDGIVLRQVVEVDQNTAFPVTADPSFWWYVKKAANCVVAVAGTVAVAAKVAQVTVKLFKMLRAARPGTALNRAYKAWLRLGSNNDQRIGNLAFNLRLIAALARQHGPAKSARIIASRGGKVKASRDFIIAGAGTIAAVTGLDSCVSLVTGKNY